MASSGWNFHPDLTFGTYFKKRQALGRLPLTGPLTGQMQMLGRTQQKSAL